MANEIFSPTSNFEKGAPVGGVSSAENGEQLLLRIDPTTKRLLVDATLALAAVDSGGLLIYRDVDTDEVGANIKATAGQIYGWYLYNTAASVRFVKLYNKATAPSVGTDIPVMTIPVPAGSGANVEYNLGIEFTLGIGIGATTGVGDNDTGAPSANDVIVNILYF